MLALDGDAGDRVRFRTAAEAACVSPTVLEDDRQDGRERYEARNILVRPDQFVAWASEEAPEDAGMILRRGAAAILPRPAVSHSNLD